MGRQKEREDGMMELQRGWERGRGKNEQGMEVTRKRKKSKGEMDGEEKGRKG